MALDALSCDHLVPLSFKGLRAVHKAETNRTYSNSLNDPSLRADEWPQLGTCQRWRWQHGHGGRWNFAQSTTICSPRWPRRYVILRAISRLHPPAGITFSWHLTNELTFTAYHYCFWVRLTYMYLPSLYWSLCACNYIYWVHDMLITVTLTFNLVAM